MMYPRLVLLKELLREDGVLFISLDDVELHHLRSMLDEIYGVENFVATIVWQKSKRGDAHLIATTHEYVVCVLKNSKALGDKVRWRQRKLGVDQVLAHYDSLVTELGKDHKAIRTAMQKWYRALPKNDPRKAHKHYNWSDDRGLYFAADFAGPDDGRESRPRYDILHPVTKKPCEKPSTGWRWDEDKTKAALAEKPPRIHFGPDETTVPCRKTYLKDVTAEPFTSVFYRDGRAGTLTLEQMLEPGLMDFPKDKDTLASLIALCTQDGEIILDSFAGSGTTAHAVLQLNAQDPGTTRRFVLVQQPFDTNEHKKSNFDICRNVTAPRVSAAIKGYTSGKEKVPALGGSFSYIRVGNPLFGEYRDLGEKLPSWVDIAKYVFYTETSREIDLKKSNEETGFIGATEAAGGTSYYLFYTPNKKEDRELSTETLKTLLKKDKNRSWVIYCEKVWLHGDHLRKFEKENGKKIRPMLVPFNLK